MTCDKAQNAVMLYHEKRLRPIKAMALHRHIRKCEDCRQFFLAFTDCELVEAPEGFTEAVMAKVMALPAHTPKKKFAIDWQRLSICAYALMLAVGLLVMPDDWATAFFSGLVQIGQALIGNVLNLSGFGNHILAIALVLSVALVFMMQKEKHDTRNRDIL